MAIATANFREYQRLNGDSKTELFLNAASRNTINYLIYEKTMSEITQKIVKAKRQ